MNAIPVLTIDDVATLDGVLADFLKKAEAELTVVIDRGGNVISQFGDMTVMDVTIIAALAAGSFAATSTASEMAMPSEPVVCALCARPASVRSDGERCTVAPQVSIIERR